MAGNKKRGKGRKWKRGNEGKMSMKRENLGNSERGSVEQEDEVDKRGKRR